MCLSPWLYLLVQSPSEILVFELSSDTETDLLQAFFDALADSTELRTTEIHEEIEGTTVEETAGKEMG